MRARTLLAVLFALPSPGAAQGFTVDSPFALVSDNAQATARLHAALGRRFRRLVESPSLETAQAAAGRPGGPAVALVVSTEQRGVDSTAYGTSIHSCQVVLTTRLLVLPAVRLVVSVIERGSAPDCGAALDQAAGRLADDLVRQVEVFRREGAGEDLVPLVVRFTAPPAEAETRDLVARLRTVPGVRRAVPQGDGTLRLDLYREPRAVAKEIGALPGVQVRSFGAGEVKLALGEAVRAAEAAPPPAPAPAEATSGPRMVPVPGTLPPTPASLPAGPLRAPAGKWALVVGVSRFKDPEVPQLTYADKDAEAFAAVLRDPATGRFEADHVFVRRNAEATVAAIKRDLDYIARSARPEDLVVFFISTHAVPGEIDAAGDSYLLGHDTEKMNLYGTGLPMRELVDALMNRVRATQVVAFLDACHTGQVLRRSAERFTGSKALAFEAEAPRLQWASQWTHLVGHASPSAAKALPGAPGTPLGPAPPAGKDVVLITSSDGAQQSWESDELQQGFFTHFLMQELKASGGQAPVDRIFEGMKAHITEAVKKEKQADQSPMIFWNGRPALVIGAPPGAPPEG